MIAKFVTKTADWMVKQKITIQTTKNDGEVDLLATGIFPSHTFVATTWSWGPEVEKLK